MTSRLRLYGVLALMAVSGACQCKNPNVNQTLKPEGVACAADEECETGLCEALPGADRLCIKKCTAGCLVNEICTPLAQDRYACVPDTASLCSECQTDADCPYPADRCIQMAGVKVCGRDCSFDSKCPDSFQCAEAVAADGSLVVSQCQPKSGTCECTAASDGQTIPCEATNNSGTCTGVKTCSGQTGYSACSARVPSAESCNGIDDDCNGQTDENLGDTTCGQGECEVTVSNCANGVAQTCTPGTAGTETCDEKDNDCDGVVDNGFDKQNDVSNCGACGNVCSLPHAIEVCTAGACSVGMCDPGWVDVDGIATNGCEYMCTLTNGGIEACDGIDNNCNGAVDEGFNLNTDPLNCGQCGLACNVSNGNVSTYQCVAQVCGIGACSSGYDNCNQTYSDGCEIHTDTDLQHCGACNSPCTTPNATPACVTGTCSIQQCNFGWKNCNNQVGDGCEVDSLTDPVNCGACGTTCPARANAIPICTASMCGYVCLPNFWDLDGNPANGCEYSCTPTGVDDPDDNFVDANCDGIDGTISKAIFVATDGNDNSPGTMALPKQTITSALNASNLNLTHIYVSGGTYSESLALKNGVSIYGGYSRAGGWTRNAANKVTVQSGVVASGRVVAVSGAGLTSSTTLDHLTIRALDTTVVGTSTYGLHCSNCTALVVRESEVFAGSAGPGANGASGAPGQNGGNGGNGAPGSCDDNTVGGPGGPAGPSTCSRTGGAGGRGGNTGDNNGLPGASGTGGTPGGGGGSGGSTGGPGGNGWNGSNGAAGTNGVAGAGGAVVGGYWIGTNGGSGAAGAGGNGGGGGGGGGGQGGFWVNDGNGNGGGGGGAGGCGGAPGAGGQAGGSSFGIFLVNSTGATIANSLVASANGGAGGAGGTGGSGGPGGFGGSGAAACTGEVGAGGDGGAGGAGGRGGHGAGGAGGASFAIYKVSSTPSLTNVTLTPGNGGPGGASSGNAGQTGPSGQSN